MRCRPAPTCPARPGRRAKGPTADGRAAVDARQRLAPRRTPARASGWSSPTRMARHGHFADAAEVLRGAVARESQGRRGLAGAGQCAGRACRRPAHAGGGVRLRRARAAAPGSPGPPYFLGFALARRAASPKGARVWADLLARTPADAPWRAELAERLGRLDAFIAERANRRKFAALTTCIVAGLQRGC